MAEKNDADAGDLAGGRPEGVRGQPELRFERLSAAAGGNGEGRADHRATAAAGASGARYKAMSPARLPIARTPCLTIPPGFSPSALLESPVLLTNVKAEPSPTTGTFNMPLVMDKAVCSDSLSSPRDHSHNNVHEEGNSADFEFKPHIRSAPNMGLSSLGTLASVDHSHQEHAPSLQVQKQYPTQMLTSSQLHNADNTTISSHELSLSVTAPNPPVEGAALQANVPDEVSSIEQLQTKCSENSTLVLSVPSGSSPSNGIEKSSEDGYNWRKYGQKHVKGSEYPRSYYKCTHPNCQMKKQLERSHDGQITEIIYKGRHDHPKPQPNRRLAVGTIFSSHGDEKTDGISPLINSDDKSSNARMPHSIDPNGISELSPVSASDDDVEAGGTRSNYIVDEVADDDDPESKRRKMDTTSIDTTHIGKPNREPRVVVQTVSEVDILDDGYRWRKYGQKVVKGNPNPRSYYKCTNAGCPVRKHVERASHDPKAVITTYEGKHNHDVPTAKTVNHDTSVPIITDGASSISNHMSAALNGVLRTCDTRTVSHQYTHLDESDTISLDLGVGISPRHMANEKQPSLGTDQVRSHMQSASSLCSNVMIQASPISALYGSSSGGLYGSRENKGEGFTFNTPPINRSSSLYYTGTGNLVMGP